MSISAISPHSHRIQIKDPSSKTLKRIQDSNCNLAIWERKLSDSLLEYVQNLLYYSDFRSLKVVHDDLENLYHSLPLAEQRGRLDFIEDIIMLFSLFRDATGFKNPSIHLTTISNMQCPLFHVDFNQIRLLCTYNGPGTLWLDEENSDRSHLGCGHNDHVVRNMEKIHEVGTGSVALLKGERYPGNGGYGIVHKSPEVPTGTKRLFLRIES
jgi:hypothetical protein